MVETKCLKFWWLSGALWQSAHGDVVLVLFGRGGCELKSAQRAEGATGEKVCLVSCEEIKIVESDPETIA